MSASFVTPWTVALQDPLFHVISQARILGWDPISLADFPNPKIEPESPALGGGFFTTEPFGQPLNQLCKSFFFFFFFFCRAVRFRGLDKILSFTPLLFFLEGGVMDRLDVL